MNNLQHRICYICDNEYPFFFNKCNVIAVSLGFKQKNGFNTNIKCIRVFVRCKVPCNKLLPKDVIPKTFKGIAVDVIESGVFKMESLDTKIRPTKGGYSIRSINGSLIGTLGCLVFDRENTYILGSSHVLYENKLPIGTPVIQPGSGTLQDTVATLYKCIDIKYKSRFRCPSNYIDCALCKLSDPSIASPEIAFVGKPKSVFPPILNLPIQKVGLTTELTKGKITDINATITTNNRGKVALFKQQILTTKMSGPGDSGALLMDEGNHSIGLHMGSAENFSAFNMISNVLKNLNVLIVT